MLRHLLHKLIKPPFYSTYIQVLGVPFYHTRLWKWASISSTSHQYEVSHLHRSLHFLILRTKILFKVLSRDASSIKPYFYAYPIWCITKLALQVFYFGLLNQNPLNSMVYLQTSNLALTPPRVSSASTILVLYHLQTTYTMAPHLRCDAFSHPSPRQIKRSQVLILSATPSWLRNLSSLLPLFLSEFWLHHTCPLSP